MSLKKKNPSGQCSLGGTTVKHMDVQRPARSEEQLWSGFNLNWNLFIL